MREHTRPEAVPVHLQPAFLRRADWIGNGPTEDGLPETDCRTRSASQQPLDGCRQVLRTDGLLEDLVDPGLLEFRLREFGPVPAHQQNR